MTEERKNDEIEAKVVGRTAFSTHGTTVEYRDDAGESHRRRVPNQLSRLEEIGPFQIGDLLTIRVLNDNEAQILDRAPEKSMGMGR